MNETHPGKAQNRRTVLIGSAVLVGLASVGAWFKWGRHAGGLSSLANRSDAPALRLLGRAYLKGTPLSQGDVEARLQSHLADVDLADAIAADHKAGRLIPVDGWYISESQALAGAWLDLRPG